MKANPHFPLDVAPSKATPFGSVTIYVGCGLTKRVAQSVAARQFQHLLRGRRMTGFSYDAATGRALARWAP